MTGISNSINPPPEYRPPSNWCVTPYGTYAPSIDTTPFEKQLDLAILMRRNFIYHMCHVFKHKKPLKIEEASQEEAFKNYLIKYKEEIENSGNICEAMSKKDEDHYPCFTEHLLLPHRYYDLLVPKDTFKTLNNVFNQKIPYDELFSYLGSNWRPTFLICVMLTEYFFKEDRTFLVSLIEMFKKHNIAEIFRTKKIESNFIPFFRDVLISLVQENSEKNQKIICTFLNYVIELEGNNAFKAFRIIENTTLFGSLFIGLNIHLLNIIIDGDILYSNPSGNELYPITGLDFVSMKTSPKKMKDDIIQLFNQLFTACLSCNDQKNATSIASYIAQKKLYSEASFDENLIGLCARILIQTTPKNRENIQELFYLWKFLVEAPGLGLDRIIKALQSFNITQVSPCFSWLLVLSMHYTDKNTLSKSAEVIKKLQLTNCTTTTFNNLSENSLKMELEEKFSETDFSTYFA